MAECKVHMLAYPYGLCISWKLLGSLYWSLDSEASSGLAEKEKALCLSEEGFPPSLYSVCTLTGQFSKKKNICV